MAAPNAGDDGGRAAVIANGGGRRQRVRYAAQSRSIASGLDGVGPPPFGARLPRMVQVYHLQKPIRSVYTSPYMHIPSVIAIASMYPQ